MLHHCVHGDRETAVGDDWRRDPLSSLGIGRVGRAQCLSFALAGALCLDAGPGVRRCPRSIVGSRAIPALVAAAGIGLIGSGRYVTDPVGEFPPAPPDHYGHGSSISPEPVRTRAGNLHNLSALPIFAVLPVATVASAFGAARRGNAGWAGLSACLGAAMAASFIAVGAAFGPGSRLAGWGGVFQRMSIASGFCWLSFLSLRSPSSLCGS